MGGLLRGHMSFCDPDPKTGASPVEWTSTDGTISLKGTTIQKTLHGNAQIVSRAGGNHILRLHTYDRKHKNRIDGGCVLVTQESSGTRSYGSEKWVGGKLSVGLHWILRRSSLSPPPTMSWGDNGTHTSLHCGCLFPCIHIIMIYEICGAKTPACPSTAIMIICGICC